MKKFIVIILTFCWSTICGQSIKDYILINTQEIKSINPSDTNFEDLEPLKKAIGDARIVMLGEQDHGDAPTFLAKTRIIKYLHEQLNFNILAFESDFYGLNQSWTTSGEINPEKIIENIYAIWTECAQTSDLFTYIDDQRNSENPLIVTGFDCRHSSKYSRINYVSEFEAMIAKASFSLDSASHKNFISILSDVIEHEYQSEISPEQQHFFYYYLNEIEKKLVEKEFEKKAFWLQELKNLQSHAQNSWRNSEYKITDKNTRDRQMGENLLWLAQEKYAGQKIIVWAHNFHIAKNVNQIEQNVKEPLVSAGGEVAKKLGDNTYIIGFNSYSGKAGRVTVGNPYNIDKPSFLGILKRKCFETWIADKGYDYAFIDLHKFSDKSNKEENYFKMKGFKHSFEKGNWTNIFDGIFYIKKMYPCNKKE